MVCESFSVVIKKKREKTKNKKQHTPQKMSGKKKTIIVKLVSAAGTGFYYTIRKNPKSIQRPLAFRKYDPVVRKHVLFKEAKMKS